MRNLANIFTLNFSKFTQVYLFMSNLVIFTFGCAESLLLCTGFSLVAASRGYSLLVGHGLLITVASFVAEHMGSRAQGLRWLQGSLAEVSKL